MITITVDTSGHQQVDHITIPWSETKQAWECGEQNDFKKLDDFINKYMKAQRSIMDDDNRYKLKHPIPRHNWEMRHAQVVKQKHVDSSLFEYGFILFYGRERVGHGAYGEVWKGFVRIDDERFLTCAIKCLSEGCSFLLLHSFPHRLCYVYHGIEQFINACWYANRKKSFGSF
ncbi:hypothetical protein Tcan_04607 [Toxocara canis]|uniref:Uncharacterized protein n=1 Tax=Toxocara canis TaxID=6265 RepID=A0A0B2W159_TOXCA|nr:hypothetical protein Tcan_04607 [Toxocara canis]